MKLVLAFAGLAAAAIPPAAATAQTVETVRVRVGLGAQLRPEWPGADETEIAPYPKFSIATGDNLFGVGAPDDSFDIKLFSSGRFSVGPALELASGRSNKEVGAPVGKVPRTVEAGAFAQYMMGENFRLRGELRKGLGGHGGMVGQAGADYIARDGDKYSFSIGPRLLFSDGKYQREFFGVTPAASLATGLPVYRPDGGIHAAAIAAGANYALGGNVGLFGYARYERLMGDARKSPIIREYGSPNQFSAGLGLNYTFTLRL